MVHDIHAGLDAHAADFGHGHCVDGYFTKVSRGMLIKMVSASFVIILNLAAWKIVTILIDTLYLAACLVLN